MQKSSDSERRVVGKSLAWKGGRERDKKRQGQVFNRLKSHSTHLSLQELVLSWPIKGNFISSVSLRVT